MILPGPKPFDGEIHLPQADTPSSFGLIHVFPVGKDMEASDGDIKASMDSDMDVSEDCLQTIDANILGLASLPAFLCSFIRSAFSVAKMRGSIGYVLPFLSDPSLLLSLRMCRCVVVQRQSRSTY